MNRKLKKMLHKHLSDIPNEIDPDVVRELTQKAKREVRASVRFEHCSPWITAFDQLRYLGWKTWTLQAFIFCAALAIEAVLINNNKNIVGKNVMFCTSMLSVLVSFSMLPFLYRARRYQMLETESAAWFSGRRLYFWRAVIFSMSDLIMATGISVSAIMRGNLSAPAAFFSALIPGLAVCTGLLYLVRKSDLIKFEKRFAVFCCVIAIIIVLCYLPMHFYLDELFLTAICLILVISYFVQLVRGMHSNYSMIYS